MSSILEEQAEAVVNPIDIPEHQKQEILQLYRKAVLTGSRAQLISPNGESLGLPSPIYKLLVQILKDLSEGASVALIQDKHGLTTSQASRMLGMSRQFFVNLLEQGDIPHTKVGTHRRVRVGDLLAYKKNRDRNRRAVLDQMLRSELEVGTGDVPLDDYSGQ